MNVKQYWRDVLGKDAQQLTSYFAEGAYINWHCTNERFTAREFITANCEYPGEWDGRMEKEYLIDNTLITVTHVYSRDRSLSFHVTSVFTLENDLIASLDEYWADDGLPPLWRQEMGLGKSII